MLYTGSNNSIFDMLLELSDTQHSSKSVHSDYWKEAQQLICFLIFSIMVYELRLIANANNRAFNEKDRDFCLNWQ